MKRRLTTPRSIRQAGRRILLPSIVIGFAAALMLPVSGAIAAETSGKTATTAQPESANAEAAIPSFDLVDLRNGRPVDLARLRTPGRAMLVWLWAPG